ncbi:hypothetical protein PsorP6_009630 [Peronosclerospora sorghi]|uniref:Uncharacterized protein n=1 Tax=Peronosclerospora sorghi TaxID=230839 RepID=A0ACC0VZF3_9STRA|nr:hypothetical protein PsorP6_009630 [Peronosclerospora sorghi]
MRFLVAAAAVAVANADNGTAIKSGDPGTVPRNTTSPLPAYAAQYFSALNKQQWDVEAPSCGRCALVFCDYDQCAVRSKSILVEIFAQATARPASNYGKP